MMSVVRDVCLENKDAFENISLLARKVTRPVEDCRMTLKRHCKTQYALFNITLIV